MAAMRSVAGTALPCTAPLRRAGPRRAPPAPRGAAMRVQAAFGGGAKKGDPFAAGSAPSPAKTVEQGPTGFRRADRETAELPSLGEADTLLAAFDTDCKGVVERDAAGLGFISEASERGLQARHPEISAACEALAGSSLSVMLGICAPSAAEGVTTLKEWVTGMGLPRGRLHGMDVNGVAVKVEGAVFIKYNSASGDADLSGYAGGFRGVLFTPTLPDGAFRQYGYLPLRIFKADE